MHSFKQVKAWYDEEVENAAKVFGSLSASLLDTYTFVLTKRKGVMGLCNYRKRQIALSEVSLTQEESVIRNTLKHEIAHALCPADNHGNKWKSTFIKLGGDGNRCAVKAVISDNHYKYKVVNILTGQIVARYHRRPIRDFSKCIVGGNRETLGKLVLMEI